jgi:hypothetical protein
MEPINRLFYFMPKTLAKKDIQIVRIAYGRFANIDIKYKEKGDVIHEGNCCINMDIHNEGNLW